VVIEGSPPVWVGEEDEVAKRPELAGAKPTLGVDHRPLLGCRDRAEEAHRVVAAGVLVIDASEVRITVVPDLAGPVELSVEGPVTVNAVAQGDRRVVEGQGVIVGREGRAGSQQCESNPRKERCGHAPQQGVHG